MPILFQHTINSNAALAVWKIEEPADFFEEQLKQKALASHPLKQLQFLAGRYLLKFMQPDFPVDNIQSLAGGKPFLIDNPFEFSITHTDRFAAAIISESVPVGIDMEMISGKAYTVAHRFLHPKEMDLLNEGDADQRYKSATLLWSIKEAIYKWQGEKGVDFRKQIRINNIDNKMQMAEGVFVGSTQIFFKVFFREIEGAMLSWVGIERDEKPNTVH